jgi:hypothetical protein
MKKALQADQVKQVMEDNGGLATLGFLYQNVDTSLWPTKTPFASIRRIVQVDDAFFRIKPGLWALTKEKARFINEYGLQDQKSEKAETFNHTYYQGLIVEIGNLENYETFIPNQDKNRLYLSKPLKDIASIEHIYEFTHREIVSRAKTVDVVWFNIRKMPAAFFEVEHSTDLHNSLIKFAELQDFNSRFRIVAANARKKEFEKKMTSTVFRDIKDNVKFVSYEDISELHANVSKYAASRKRTNI